jgi:LysM repeat protein
MKLIKIFSSVLALHIVALTVFFLSPGCQSKPKSDSAAAGSPPPAAVQPVEENWMSQGAAGYDSVQPVVPASSAPAPLTGPTPAERVRQSPTRPVDDRGFYGRPATVKIPAPESIDAPVLAEYTVVPGDSLWRIANNHGITVAELQKMNPGVRANSLQPGAVLNVPASWSGSGAGSASGSVTSSAATSTYVVRGGDSLSKIAARNGTTVGALRRANNLASDNIQVGQILNIPEGSTPPPPDDSAPARGGSITVTVQRGDTLGAIAKKFDVTVAELMDENNISDPRRVRAGQVLIVPGFQAVGSGRVPNVTPPPSQPEPRMIPAPVVETTRPPISVEPVTPADEDLDALLPDDAVDAPVVPIDDPVPQP